MPIARLPAPTMRVPMHTAGLRVSLPKASAMKAAPPSCRVAMTRIFGVSYRASSKPRKLSPGTQNAWSTPAASRAWTTAWPPVLTSTPPGPTVPRHHPKGRDEASREPSRLGRKASSRCHNFTRTVTAWAQTRHCDVTISREPSRRGPRRSWRSPHVTRTRHGMGPNPSLRPISPEPSAHGPKASSRAICLEELRLLEVFGRHVHQVDARRLGLGGVVFVVVTVAVARAALGPVRTFFVRVQQRAALVQAEPLLGRPARPLRTHGRMRTAPVDQSTAQGVLRGSGEPDGAAQSTPRGNLGERIAQATHRSVASTLTGRDAA